MSGTHLIIDGNNLVHHLPELLRMAASDFDQARLRLARRVDEVAAALPFDRITIVFDGARDRLQAESASPAVEILFSPSNMTADSIIERMVHEAPDASAVTVVTSDRGERDTVEASGAVSMGCTNFVEMLEERAARIAAGSLRSRRQAPGPRLGDFFP